MITKLDDFRHATKVLSQGDNATKRRFSKVVYRGLSIVEVVVWNALQVGGNQPLYLLHAMTYRVRCHLLFVADDNMLTSEVDRGKRRYVTLAGLVNDNDIELRLTRIEALIYSA